MDANSMLQGRYLNAADLKGRSIRVTIATVAETRFRDGTWKLVLTFDGARKALALNKTNLRAVIAVLGGETDTWPGQRLTLEPRKVEYGGDLVDGVRIAAPPEPPRAAPAPAPPSPPAPRDPGDDWQAGPEDVPFGVLLAPLVGMLLRVIA